MRFTFTAIKCEVLCSSNKLLLSDSNECLIDGSCDQVCINKNGTFDCRCVLGYEKNNSSCIAVNGKYEHAAYSTDFLHC
jgi:hypothetical protein